VRYWAANIAVSALVVAGCGGNDSREGNPTSASEGSPAPTTAETPPSSAQASGPEVVPPSSPAVAAPEPELEPEPEPEPALVIVSCQIGLGPIETYWSDGSVTGWSDFCQSQHDDVLRREREANDPNEKQIAWCGTDKQIYNRGMTFYTDGSSSSWTQYCANQFDGVNNPPLPPGANGGGGAVAGPCDTPGAIAYTPDGLRQQCSGGHWVYIR